MPPYWADQSKVPGMLDKVSLKDHVTTQSLLLKYNLSYVNQLAGEIKLLEAWKSINIEQYPSLCVCLLTGVTRLQFIRSTEREPSIHIGPRIQEGMLLASAQESCTKTLINIYHNGLF